MSFLRYHELAKSFAQRYCFWVLGFAGILAGTAWLFLRPAPSSPAVEVRRDTLTLQNGRLYRPGETQPFTGVMIECLEEGTLLSRSCVSNGLLEGISEGYYPSGQTQVREHFHEGVSHGRRIKWHPNGQKLSEAFIVQGKIEGMFRRWHENGSLAEEVPMKAGQPDGLARSYFASGFIKAEAQLRSGQVIDQHFWSDGEYAGLDLAQNSHAPLKDGP